jgi:S1-C subfamily serine protease
VIGSIKEVAMKLKRRQYTLIVTTVLTVGLALAACGLLFASTDVLADFRSPSEAKHSAKAVVAPDLQPEMPINVSGEPAWLGIVGATVQPEVARAMGLPADQSGVLVHFVESRSPASTAGILGSESVVVEGEHRWLVGGDVITALDSQPVDSMRALQGLLSQSEPGQQVSLTVMRNGELVTVSATLADYPELDLSPSSSRLRVT